MYEDYGNTEYEQYIQSLATTQDVQNCLSTYSNDPIGLTNCVRALYNLPPITAGTIPTVDNNTLTCIQGVLSKYPGAPGSTTPIQLPFQTVINMVNEIRACLGLPAVPIPALVTCIMGNCMMGMQPGSGPQDITTCVNNCITSNQV